MILIFLYDAFNRPGPFIRFEAHVTQTDTSKSGSARKAATKKLSVMPGGSGSDAAKPSESSQTDTRKPAPVARPVASTARPKRRHRVVLASFVLIFALPMLLTGWYLWDRAEDQYASKLSFSVRSADSRSALDVSGILGPFGGGATSTDADVLNDYIHSQELVTRVDAQLDLRSLYARHHASDPVFGFNPDGTIEDLVNYWQRMVQIKYDPGPGLIELTVRAFDPHEARAIATAILEESTEMINRLSAIAREDTTRYAREELDMALERLREARAAVTEFRSRTQIVDPSADVQGQMGLLNTLQGELASALIELDLLRETISDGDPRIAQAERRIDVTRRRISEERARFGNAGADAPVGEEGESYATLVSEFERLSMDREFAEQAYRSAQSAYDGALAEAQRVNRYLAAHVEPTLAESPRYPQRLTLAGLTGLFLFLGWVLSVLVYYSIRDRR